MKNLYLFIQINFIPFKVIPSLYNALMYANVFSNRRNTCLIRFPELPSKPSSIRLVSLQSCQNGVLGVVFWVWGIAKSHTEPNQANMVVVERYSLSFWRNGNEEWVQCETAHYRDAKNTSCLPKISFETVLNDPLEMPIVSAKSLTVNRRFLCTNSLIWLTCCLSVDVDGRPGRSLNSLYHL